MGSVRQKRTGNWEARYRDTSGKQRGKVFDTKRRAEQFLQRTGADMQRGDWLDPAAGKTTFATVAQQWLATRTDLTPATRAGYETCLAQHLLPAFGSRALASIGAHDVHVWISELAARRAPGTVRNSFFLLSAILKLAVRYGYIKASPAAGMSDDRSVLPRSRKQEQHFLDASEVARLADAHAEHYRDLILTAAYTGLRAGELAALRVRHVDLMRRRLHVRQSMTYVEGRGYVEGETKNRQARTVPLPGFLVDKLSQRIENKTPDDHVFTDSKGEHLRHNTFYRRHFKPSLKRAQLNPQVRFHDLRHTAASLLIQQGAHPKAVCDWLGHSTITITMDRYGHLYPGELGSLADKLDATYRAVPAVPAAAAGEVVALP